MAKSSVREYAILYVGGKGHIGGGTAGGGNVLLNAGQHDLGGPEHRGQLPAARVSVDTTGFVNSAGDDAQEVLADFDAAILAAAGSLADAVEVVAISEKAVEFAYELAHWWDITLTDDCTLTIVNPPDDQVAGELVVILRQGGAGSFTVTWPAEVQWAASTGLPGGSAPTLHTAVGAQDVVTLTSVDGGITWGGSTGGLTSVDAADVTYDNAGSTLVAADVEAALDELAAAVDALEAVPAPSGGDHVHGVDEQFNGDGATTVFPLSNEAIPDTVMGWVAGARTPVTLGGTLNDEVAFAVAPGSGTNNVSIDYAAAL